MAKFEIHVPKLGESIIEATITKWLKKEGDTISEDEAIAEIATDKVDSEIPSPVGGVIVSILAKEGDVVPVGTVIAVIEEEGGAEENQSDAPAAEKKAPVAEKAPVAAEAKTVAVIAASEIPGAIKAEKAPVAAETPSVAVIADAEIPGATKETSPPENEDSKRFYSPLVKNIAKQENLSIAELASIPGTGLEGRLTKQDLLAFLKTKKEPVAATIKQATQPPATHPVTISGDDQVIEMDRVRQLIAGHMIRSVQTSAHVTSFVETDMTGVVMWRERNKEAFQKREGIKLTYTPVIIEAIAKTIRDYPTVNVSVDGTRIILHKNINIGMAVALPNDNLIVPVIKNADQKNLLGIVRMVTDIAERARINKLVPDEIAGGTISLTNFGSFGTLMGIPIINQPQTAIVGVGTITKRPVILETPSGDTIAIRHMMYLSLTYDHRVIDGALAGKFLNKMQFYLEKFDINQTL